MNGFLPSIDEPITEFLPDLPPVARETTIRHLLTHTHGLTQRPGGKLLREFAPGQGWAYRDTGVRLLTDIIQQTTGRTVAEIVLDQVIQPLGLTETGWYPASQRNSQLVDVLRDADNPYWVESESPHGDAMNMYVSARELAYWGYVHLTRGRVGGRQLVPEEVLQLATTLQSPPLPDPNLPQHGFLWFVKDAPAQRTEIGDRVPAGSFQLLGYTGAAILVIPAFDVVAVRMFNRFGSPQGYDYLQDIRSFGDCVVKACFP